MKKFLKNSEGFTLVELMVVVAIIGILSAVAIPNFKKYQAKSKQSEAKIQLAALYSSEVSANSDFDTYASCLAIMGYETVPRGYYLVGFTAGYSAVAVNTAFTGCDATGFLMTPGTHLAVVTGNKPAAIPAAVGTTVAQNAFKAGASGSISSNPSVAANTVDSWSINQSKALVNDVQGY